MEESVHALAYNGQKAVQLSELDLGNFLKFPEELVRWIDVGNLSDRAGIEDYGRRMAIHPLIIEDILNVSQMVKIDNYDDCLFLVLKMIYYDPKSSGITTEHVSIVLKDGVVASFQEKGTDLFGRVREKILQGRDSIRKSGADYLCYELIDTVVDNYFSVIDQLGDAADAVEEELIADPAKTTLQQIYFIKRELMYLRKSVYPLREIIGNLTDSSTPLLSQGVRIYLHDVYDHLVQIVDSIETYQDILSNMLDTYLSSISNKTNDTMKILTIFSTIFIPLTFLAGIYGMNFKNIPELSLPYGYVLFWVLSAVIALSMLLFFHRKKWF